MTAALGVIAMSAVGLFFLWLSCLALNGAIFADANATTPVLKSGWSIFMWILELGTALGVIYGGLFTAVSTGLTYLGTLYTSKRALAVLIGIALLGILFCSIVMFQIDRGHTDVEPIAVSLSSMSAKYPTAAAFKAAADTLIISIIGWLGAFIVAQLGISKLATGGALK